MKPQNGPPPPPPPPPPPRISVTGPGTISVSNGQTATVEFTVLRFLTDAAVGLSVRWLPSGVTASFNPSEIPASASARTVITMTLTAAPNAFASQTPIQIQASADGVASSYAWITVRLDSPYSLIEGAPILSVGPASETNVATDVPVMLAPFGTATIALNLQLEQGLNGAIASGIISQTPPGVTEQFSPATFTAPGQPGFVAVQLTLDAGVDAKPGTSSVSWAIIASGAERGVFTFPLTIVAPFVATVLPSAGEVPEFGQPGTLVTIGGGGFGPGTTVAFGNDSPVPASSVAAGGTSLEVTVPPTAASGPLIVVSPAAAATGDAVFAVDNYRNTRGFSWQNSIAFQDQVTGTSYSHADAAALFGLDNVYISIFGKKFFNPLVDELLAVADNMLTNGQCFGMSLGSLRFVTGQSSLTGLPQQPAGIEPDGPAGPDVWLLAGPGFTSGTDVSPSLASFIHQQHLAQLSQECIDSWVGFHASVTSASGLRSALAEALGGGTGALVLLDPAIGEGHAVVAYQVVDTGGGAFDILVYNCNTPFQPGEDLDPQARASAAGQSVINVMADGSWSFSELGWTGGIFNITVMPWAAIPQQPSVPWAELVAGTLAPAVLWLVVGAAQVSQTSDGLGHLLLADGRWNTDPDTMLPGTRPLPSFGGLGRSAPPAFVSTVSGPLVHTITGASAGSYDLYWLGSGYGVTLTGVSAAPGTSDTALIYAGKVDFTAAEDKALTASVTGTALQAGLPRTATLTTQVSARAAATLTFDAAADTFSYTHDSEPATFAVELASFDETGEPVSFQTAGAQVSPGETVTFAPDWDHLTAGAGTVTVQNAAGQATSRPLAAQP